MVTVPTARLTVLPSARAWGSPTSVEVGAPPIVHLPDLDDPNVTAWVSTHMCVRLAMLTTAEPGKIAGPLNDAHTAPLTFSIHDPGAWALRRDDGTWATSENESVEIHVYRKHRIIEQFAVAHAKPSTDGQTVDLTLVDAGSWYLQQRRRGLIQPKNLADLAHWNGQDPFDGLFDAGMAGWSAYGGATALPVSYPAYPAIDVFAPWSVLVTAPASPVPTGMGLAKIIDASQDVHGQKWRFIARNWHPSGQPEFYFETAMRVTYMPPGVTDPADARCTTASYSWDPTTTEHVRDTWNEWSVDIDVPVNVGGRLLLIMEAPDLGGHTYWGSRWKVIREDVFGTNDLANGDLPGTIAANVIADLALPGDTPYRNLSVDGSSPAGARQWPRYGDIEAHSPYDILQTACKQGGVNWRWDYTPKKRTLRVGNLYTYQWAWPITLDSPSGYLEALEADATQARNRVRYQGTQSDWSRDQEGAIAVPRRGAVIDDVIVAPRQMLPEQLFMAAAQHLTWSKETPQIVTGSLPGDAIHECRPGDFHPVAVHIDGGFQVVGLLRSTSLDYDPATDRCSVTLSRWTPVDAS